MAYRIQSADWYPVYVIEPGYETHDELLTLELLDRYARVMAEFDEVQKALGNTLGFSAGFVAPGD